MLNGAKNNPMKQSANNKKPGQPKRLGNAIISNEVRDYGNHPYFVKKADDSKKFLEEHGFPEDPRRSMKNI
jgi:hypothetical protein